MNTNDTPMPAHEAQFEGLSWMLGDQAAHWFRQLVTDDEKVDARQRIEADAPWCRVEAFEGIEELRVLSERLTAVAAYRLLPLLFGVLDLHTKVEALESKILNEACDGRMRETDELTKMLTEATGTARSFDVMSLLLAAHHMCEGGVIPGVDDEQAMRVEKELAAAVGDEVAASWRKLLEAN